MLPLGNSWGYMIDWRGRKVNTGWRSQWHPILLLIGGQYHVRDNQVREESVRVGLR